MAKTNQSNLIACLNMLNMSLEIGGGYSVLASYQLLRLKYRPISPSSSSPNYLSQLNIDEMDHSL